MRLVSLTDLHRMRSASLARKRAERHEREACRPRPFAEAHREQALYYRSRVMHFEDTRSAPPVE